MTGDGVQVTYLQRHFVTKGTMYGNNNIVVEPGLGFMVIFCNNLSLQNMYAMATTCCCHTRLATFKLTWVLATIAELQRIVVVVKWDKLCMAKCRCNSFLQRHFSQRPRNDFFVAKGRFSNDFLCIATTLCVAKGQFSCSVYFLSIFNS